MRCVIFTHASCVIPAAACLLAGGSALWAGEMPATRPAAPQSPPELRRGEIVIRHTGRTKRVVAVPAPAAATGQPADLPYDGPGPRVVTIGYLVRDPLERGWGPRVHCPAPQPFGFGCAGPCDPFGYRRRLPTSGFGAPVPFNLSHCPPAPLSHGFRRR